MMWKNAKLQIGAFTILLGLFLIGLRYDRNQVDDVLQTEGLSQEQRLPSFDIPLIGSGRFSDEKLAGRVAVLDFWATWCHPCIQEIPELNELHARYRTKGVVITGITFESGSSDEVRSEMARLGIEYPVAMGDTQIQKAFGGIWGYPTTIIVGPDGRILKKIIGNTPQKHGEIIKMIEQYI